MISEELRNLWKRILFHPGDPIIRERFIRLLNRIPLEESEEGAWYLYRVTNSFLFRHPGPWKMSTDELFLFNGRRVKTRGMEFEDVEHRVEEALEKGWVALESYWTSGGPI